MYPFRAHPAILGWGQDVQPNIGGTLAASNPSYEILVGSIGAVEQIDHLSVCLFDQCLDTGNKRGNAMVGEVPIRVLEAGRQGAIGN